MYAFYILIFLLGLIALYLYAIKPNKKRNMDFILGRLYSHRGLHDNKSSNPENSMRAFELAVEKGFGIELDVQVTKDNIPLVFHDKTLSRACGLDKCIPDFKVKDLKEVRLFGSDQYIPSLEEVLDLVDGRVPLIVEIKNETSDISELSYISEILDAYKGDYGIESFNPLVVWWYKKNRPHIIRGQLSAYFKKSGKTFSRKFRNLILENLLTNFLTKPDFIAFNYKHKAMLSFNLCKKLYKPLTVAYTIKNEKELEKNKDDFDLIIFDSFIPKNNKIKMSNKKSARS